MCHSNYVDHFLEILFGFGQDHDVVSIKQGVELLVRQANPVPGRPQPLGQLVHEEVEEYRG